MVLVRSLTTFMAGVPGLQRSLTTPEPDEDCDIDAMIEAFRQQVKFTSSHVYMKNSFPSTVGHM